jgi:hypothetical protein
MFLTDCHTCGLRELRGPRAIQTLVNTGSGIGLVYRCTGCETMNAVGSTRPAEADAPSTTSVAA